MDSASSVVLIISLHKWTSGVSSTNPRCSQAMILISMSLKSRNMIVRVGCIDKSCCGAVASMCSPALNLPPEPVRCLINLATRWSPSHRLFSEIDLFFFLANGPNNMAKWVSNRHKNVYSWRSAQQMLSACVYSKLILKMLRNEAQLNYASMSAT